MNHRLLSYITFVLIVLQSTAVNAQWERMVPEKKYIYERPDHLFQRSSFTEDETYNEWDLTYNRLELKVDPAKYYIEGNVTFVFTSLKDNLSSITIDLDSCLTVSSVTSGGNPLRYQHSNHRVFINLPSQINKNEVDSFTVYYSGKPTSTGLGSFTQSYHDSNPAIFTLSEPTGAKEWWPCKESLSDKIDSIDVLVETPSRYLTASNGILVSDNISGTKRICHWKHRHPITNYLVFFSSTNYDVYSEWATLNSGTNVKVLNYVYLETLEEAKSNTPYAEKYLEFFSQKFIDYPFKDEKYGHAQFGWNGGMEHQTMTSLGMFYPDLIAHELAHQWFGDYITCGNWNEIWLNEGFATYLEGIVYEEFEPETWTPWKQSLVNNITSSVGGSVYVENTDDVDRLFDSRLTYDKGAYVLHMLRGQIGDDAFFKGLKSYLTDPRVIDGFTTTDIFRENMEQAADTTLSEFFNDWIWGEGYPVYDISWNYRNQQVNITVNQQPSTTSGPFFEMKLPVTITTNGTSQTYWLPNTEQGEEYSIPMASAPESVQFNNELWILCKESDLSATPSELASEHLKVLYNADEKYITTTVPGVENAGYTIFNLQGQKVVSGEWERRNPVIRLNRFRSGIYILNLSTTDKKYTARFSCY